jgi:hypothetical protein
VKRITNSALAAVVLHEIKESTSTSDEDFFHERLKLAYACFLRLNSDPEALTKKRFWKHDPRSGTREIVDALMAAFRKISKDSQPTNIQSDWSGISNTTDTLLTALGKCKEFYPNISGNYFSVKKTAKQKKKGDSTNDEDTSSPSKKRFSVEIPEGLSEGDTFVTLVNIGDTSRKVRLTGPPGAVSKIRFGLDDMEVPSKRQRVEED